MTDIQKQLAEALEELSSAVQALRTWPGLQRLMKLRESTEFCNLVIAWEEAQAVLSAHRQQEARDPGLINALRVAWSGYVNLSADMEPGPLRKQMNKHADALQGVLEAHGIKGE